VSATGEPIQLSVQPDLVTIANHLSAAAAAAPPTAADLLSGPPGLQQHLLQQQLQGMTMLDSLPSGSAGYSNIPQDWQLAGQQQQQFVGGTMTCIASATAAAPAAGSPSALAGTFTPSAAAAAGGAGTVGPLGNAGSLSLMQLPGYAASAAAALAPVHSSATDLNATARLQQQQQQQQWNQGSRAMLLDCSSSTSCSPLMSAGSLQPQCAAVSSGVLSMMCNRTCFVAPASMPASADACAQESSPTASTCSSGSGSGGGVLLGAAPVY
jgi:hypothetical protein